MGSRVQPILQFMGPKISNISSYTPLFTDIFFFDTNIWMYLFCPLGNYNVKKQRIYSLFYSQLIQRKSTLFVNSLLLSEFSNAYLRLDFELWKKETQNYSAIFKKDFVGSARYGETVTEIKAGIQNILKFSEKSPDEFNALNIDNITQHLEFIDFNDSYYIELAKIKNWIIVTDDGDFTNYNKHNSQIITITN